MVQLKPKVTLTQKSQEAFVSVKQLIVKLKWTKDVDLDLMAFYKAKDGCTGAVFSENYPGGSLGNLNSFPFIELSGDAGVGATAGDNEEVLRITKLDDIAELYIVTLNYSDAIEQRDCCFADYDGSVSVTDDTGENIEIPLNATDRGYVAVICRIDNTSAIGAKIVNMNEVMALDAFAQKLPGTDALVG